MKIIMIRSAIKSGISIPIRKYGDSALWKAEATAARRQRALLHSQASEAYFRSHADYVVTNNGLLDETYRQIDEGIKKL